VVDNGLYPLRPRLPLEAMLVEEAVVLRIALGFENELLTRLLTFASF
jgi:hypothetical protein